MRLRRAESMEELAAVLAEYSNGHLFRGQAQHYTTDSGNPSIVSSFSRRGCIPETTRKWTFWAQLVLDLLGAPFDEHLGMALMQHYGWRSFYVDVTSDTAVAAWFAAHKLQVTKAFDLPQHLSVVMGHDIGNYSLADGDVSVYVFNIGEVQRHGYSVQNLATYLTDPSCRPVRQRAWAMGPLNRFNPTLNPSCIAARVVAPVSVMQGYAATHGLWSPTDLFPSAERDFVLRFLEQQPWISIGENAYVRSFRYPDYHGAPSKPLLSPILYRRTWLVDGTEPGFKGALRWRAPAEILCSFSSRKMPLPGIWQMLERHTCVVIEVDSLVRLPMLTAGDRECFKGVVVQRLNDLSIEISELFAEWEWTSPLGVGTNMPYTYDIEPNGVLHRRQSEQDCPCGNDDFHEMHLALVEIIEETAARHAARIDASGIHYVVPWSEG